MTIHISQELEETEESELAIAKAVFFDVLNDRSPNHSVPLTQLAAREVKNGQFRAEILPYSVLSILYTLTC